LNSRPHHYQWCALPLSYRSIPGGNCNNPLQWRGFCHNRPGSASKSVDDFYKRCPRLKTKLRGSFLGVTFALKARSMNDKTTKPVKIPALQHVNMQESRQKRLAEALRDNLAKRKAQNRAWNAEDEKQSAWPVEVSEPVDK
jgi:hypothetical protein